MNNKSQSNIKKLTWTQDTVYFVGKVMRNHVDKLKTYPLKIKGIGFQQDSLMYAAVSSLSSVLHEVNAYQITWSFEALFRNEEAIDILKSKPSTLLPQDIEKLFTLIEDAVTHHSREDKYAQSLGARRPFRDCYSKLANTEKVSAIYTLFTSRFNSHNKRMPSRDLNESLKRELETIPFEDIKELDAKAKQTYENTKKNFLEICESELDRAEEIKQQLRQAKSATLKDEIASLLTRESVPQYRVHLQRATIEEIFEYNCNRVEKLALYKEENFNSIGLKTVRGNELIDKLGYFSFQKNVGGTANLRTRHGLLADYFLPSRTLYSCQVILQLSVGLNASVIRELSRERIVPTGNGYTLAGMKNKTGKTTKKEINKIDHPLAVRAIGLLLWHDDNVSKYWNRTSDAVFVTLRQDKETNEYSFSLSDLIKQHKGFIKWHGLIHYAPDDLRDLYAESDYVSHKDPFRVQAILDHSNIVTTQEYLKSNVIAALSKANINEFMKRLSSSIMFSVDKDLAKKHGFDESNVDKKLLFPTNNNKDVSDAISDEWLMSEGDLQFSLDREVIEHCVYQKKYYENNLSKLLNRNPEKFRAYHLGRILFCMALYEVIEASEYSYVLREVENAE